MIDIESNEEVKTSMNNIKTWLASRKPVDEDADEVAIVKAHEGLRAIGFADLSLQKAGPEHQEGIVFCHDNSTQKPKVWTELHHLVNWTTSFLKALNDNKLILVTLELMRGGNDMTIKQARYNVDEAIKFVIGLLNFETGLDIQHPDTRGLNYASSSMLIEESNSINDIIKHTFTCLFTKCVVNLVVKVPNYYSSILTAYLVDLMRVSGATSSEIKCLSYDKRDSIGNEKFNKCQSPSKGSKLSTIATVFNRTDTFAAAQGIIESYFREQYANLIILVEESAYERFVRDWQRFYSHAMTIGSRLDNSTTVVANINEKVQIDLASIDIKASHKMSGMAINVLKFRTLSELLSLLSNLRKVPFINIWLDDAILARDLCIRINISNDFWINHCPRSLISRGHKISEQLMSYYADLVADDMANIYNSVYLEFSDEVESLRKLQVNFMKKDANLRQRLICQAYLSLINRSKSLKNGSTNSESIAHLRRIYHTDQIMDSPLTGNGSQKVETLLKPVGLAILLVREEATSTKSKPSLVEFIFRNFLLGNAVLLVCPPNTLGAKFALDDDHVIPFKMVHDNLPDISRLSLDSSFEGSPSAYESSSAEMSSANVVVKKSCPQNTYAIEILPEMNSETFQMLLITLGTRRKTILYPEADQSNYWANE